MIIDLKRHIDLRWLIDDRSYIHLRWSCFVTLFYVHGGRGVFLSIVYPVYSSCYTLYFIDTLCRGKNCLAGYWAIGHDIYIVLFFGYFLFYLGRMGGNSCGLLGNRPRYLLPDNRPIIFWQTLISLCVAGSYMRRYWRIKFLSTIFKARSIVLNVHFFVSLLLFKGSWAWKRS